MNSVLYVQNATHRAGAQTCLVRLVSDFQARHWNPVVLCSSAGWLTEECTRRGISYLIEPFPRSRSLTSRLLWNANFARKVKAKLDRMAIQPKLVHANDHWEGVLGIQLAKILSARSAIFLRTSRLTQDQYFKYQGNRYDLVIAVGATLQAKVQRWSREKRIALYFDGVEQEDFLPPAPKLTSPPTRLLVIGAPRSSKGWADVVSALELQAKSGKWLPQRVDFTGIEPTPAENDLKLHRVSDVEFNFLGHVDHFRELVRGYQLVVNPSRIDSFGMAAVETIAAGVPLLSSRSGVLHQVVAQDTWLFKPGDPAGLADALNTVITRWGELDFDISAAQETIRRRFSIRQSVNMLDDLYCGLEASSAAKRPNTVGSIR